MHAEITRLVTAWLKHTTYGVNALLPDIPRDIPGRPDEEDEEPKAVAIYNDIDATYDDVRGFNPPTVPAIAVIADTEPDGMDISQKFKAGQEYGFTVGVGYYSEFEDRSRARRDGNYVLRAVGQSLTRFNQAKQSDREINGILIARLTKLSFQKVAGAVPPSQLMGMVFADGILLNKAP